MVQAKEDFRGGKTVLEALHGIAGSEGKWTPDSTFDIV